MAGKNKIFIATDDYASYEEFRRLCPADWEIVTLCKPHHAGFFLIENYFNLNDHQREAYILGLLADLHMMVNADAFIGCFGTNVSRTAVALRGAQNCRMLDYSVEDYRKSYPYL